MLTILTIGMLCVRRNLFIQQWSSSAQPSSSSSYRLSTSAAGGVIDIERHLSITSTTSTTTAAVSEADDNNHKSVDPLRGSVTTVAGGGIMSESGYCTRLFTLSPHVSADKLAALESAYYAHTSHDVATENQLTLVNKTEIYTSLLTFDISLTIYQQSLIEPLLTSLQKVLPASQITRLIDPTTSTGTITGTLSSPTNRTQETVPTEQEIVDSSSSTSDVPVREGGTGFAKLLVRELDMKDITVLVQALRQVLE